MLKKQIEEIMTGSTSPMGNKEVLENINDNCEVIKVYDSNKSNQIHLANLYYLHKNPQSLGTIFGIHGHGGSPYDISLTTVAKQAPDFNFNFIMIESLAMSITYDNPIKGDFYKMNLSNHKKAIANALITAYKKDKSIYSGYNISVAHSMGGRAITDLILDSLFIREMFSEYTFVNPYFLSLQKLLEMIEKYKQKDPSGKKLKEFLERQKVKKRNINGRNFEYSICAADFNISLPDFLSVFCKDIHGLMGSISDKMQKCSNRKTVNFMLGTADEEADWKQSELLFNELHFENCIKYLYEITGGDHHLENSISNYVPEVQIFLERARRNAFLYKHK
ncbi:MAG: hypothetical protein JW985_00805 [Alphaproteobacteria bacterium]|nr:hypothetical protein [Alphaproteobacteria bacterium]